MLPFLTERFANPSGSHRFARDARRAVDEARDVVADVIGCRPGEVVFTGGGTEADNAAIAGAVGRRGGTRRVPGGRAPRRAARRRARTAARVVAVDAAGRVDLDALAGALGDDVAVVSVMAVNNEVGIDHRPRRGRRASCATGAPGARAAHRRRAGRLLARPARRRGRTSTCCR